MKKSDYIKVSNYINISTALTCMLGVVVNEDDPIICSEDVITIMNLLYGAEKRMLNQIEFDEVKK